MCSTDTTKGCFSNTDACFECLLSLKFTPDLKWNSDMPSILIDAGEIVGLLYRPRNYLVSSEMLIFTRARLDQQRSISVIYGKEMTNHHCPSLTKFKMVSKAL